MSSIAKTTIYNVDSAPSDTPSCISISPVHDLFAVSSWDGSLYFYNIQNPSHVLKSCIPLNFPLLTTCFHDQAIYTGCIKGNIYITDLFSGQTNTIKLHENGLKNIKSLDPSVFVTSSWDKQVKLIDSRTNSVIHTINAPERVYNMACGNQVIVITTAGNKILTYDTRFYKETSYTTKLVYQIKSLALLNDGICVGGIEGRAEFMSLTNAARRTLFRCHRTAIDLYSVNVIIPHTKRQDIIFSGGNDNQVLGYDVNLRQRIYNENVKGSVTCMEMKKEGDYIVVGTGYDWSKGYEMSDERPQIMIMDVASMNLK